MYDHVRRAASVKGTENLFLAKILSIGKLFLKLFTVNEILPFRLLRYIFIVLFQKLCNAFNFVLQKQVTNYKIII